MRSFCVVVAGLLLSGALAERPQLQSGLETVEVRAHGHLARKKDKKETCWGDLGESTVAKDAGSTVDELSGKSLQECMDACAEKKSCKSLSYKAEGESCYLKDKEVTGDSDSKHVDGITTYYEKACEGDEEEGSGSDEGESGSGEGSGEGEGGSGGGGGGGSGSSASFKVTKFKPDIDCNFDDDAFGRAEAQVQAFASEGYDIIGLIEIEHELEELEGYWYAGAQCQDHKYGDPVIIGFKKGVFEWVDSIGGQTAKVDWSQLPYVGGGGKDTVKGTGIEGYSKAKSCTANYDREGVRAYAGAKVKHLPSGTEICVLVGTLPHNGPHHVADWYRNAIHDAGCPGKPILAMFDQNYNGAHADFDLKHEWGKADDPGLHGECHNGKGSGCTCCLNEGMGSGHLKTLKYDRIVLFTPDGSGKVEDFEVKSDWVCNAKGEHKITTATINLG